MAAIGYQYTKVKVVAGKPPKIYQKILIVNITIFALFFSFK